MHIKYVNLLFYINSSISAEIEAWHKFIPCNGIGRQILSVLAILYFEVPFLILTQCLKTHETELIAVTNKG